MKKAEYIEKYGEEKYKEYLEKSRVWNKTTRERHKEDWKEKKKEWSKKYRESHREKIREHSREYSKIYYQTHKEKNVERKKKYYNENKERISAYNKEYCKIYYQENKDKHNEKSKLYREENKEKIIARRKEYAKTKRGRAQSLRHTYTEKDKAKNLDVSNNITLDWIVENIFSGQACIYCGDNDWTHLGCDRIDNDKPHTADNVVCSCFLCNADRADRYSVEEFKKYRALHPRACDIPKGPSIILSPSGALKKKSVPI